MACLLGPIPAGAGETWSRPMPQSDQRAYPRWRGGNAHQGVTPLDFEGLSPLARGKHADRGVHLPAPGPIPAGAGETAITATEPRSSRAYPRWRGGNGWRWPGQGHGWGLSPLARGKRVLFGGGGRRAGPIPAGAGETSGVDRRIQPGRAYPRWRGGNGVVISNPKAANGLSPLARGKRLRRR